MRVSTNMIYDRGVATMQRQTAELLRTQQQVSSGRRILTPADDPIGAARALETTQAQSINKQFVTNKGYAEDNLKLLESRLTGVGEVLQYFRERTVQAGNASLSPTELGFIATDLRAQYDALVALANSRDANNDYLFAGYKAQTLPFQGGFGAIDYVGDEGTRTIQVSSSRFMPVSFSGSDVFQRTRVPDESAITVSPASANTGSAALTPGANSAPDVPGARYIVEWSGGAYTAVRREPGVPDVPVVVTPVGAPPTSIEIEGMNFSVSGAPDDGDRFEVFAASTDMFANLAMLIDAIERPGPVSVTAGAVAFGLTSLDAALDNTLRVRAQIGSQLVELDSLRSVAEDLDVQYAQTLSRLQDVDFAEAISRLTRQQTFLEAAQASFVRVTGLSLFNFIN
jgi:flagellar hook-associated protein 3 FlgL